SGQSIRLASINAPETEFCLGKEAKKRLEDLVLGKRIKLEVTSRESYNRMIGLVSLRDTLINQIMLEEGLSRYDSSGIK
ncbi:MAG: thermonuclease family protein, partial [Candidatus Nealsonbacteria bacterium]|nr:thermonuclease family protein [Candidatus Nealsonbacteria bacterium]